MLLRWDVFSTIDAPRSTTSPFATASSERAVIQLLAKDAQDPARVRVGRGGLHLRQSDVTRLFAGDDQDPTQVWGGAEACICARPLSLGS